MLSIGANKETEMLIFLWVSVLAFPEVKGSCIYAKECPNIQPMIDIDFKRYTGVWEDILHSSDLLYSCPEYKYTYETCNPPVMVETTAALDEKGVKFNGVSRYQLGGRCLSCNAVYLKLLPGPDSVGNGRFLPPNLNCFVLETDYVSYTVEYCCKFVNGKVEQTTAVSIRKGKKPLPMSKIAEVYRRNNVDPKILQPSCPQKYIPQ